MGGFGLQILLEMSPSPFLSTCSGRLDRQFLLRSLVTSLGALLPSPFAWGQQMVRVEDAVAKGAEGTARGRDGMWE